MAKPADAHDDARAAPTSRAWLFDALLAIGVTVVVALVISANQGGRQEPDAIAYLWAAGLGALMLVRRRWPRAVLAISVLGLFAYYAAGYPAVGVAVPVAAAVYSSAEMGRLAAAIGGSLAVVVVSVGFRLLEGQAFTFVVGYELAGHVLLLAAAIALGDSVRSRREVAVSARRLVASTAEQERQRARSDAHEARVAVARDLHDNLGHAVTVIALHADVAREALGPDDDAAREAIGVVKDTSQSVMAELRATVRRLREPAAGDSGLRTLAELPELLHGVPLEIAATLDAPSGLDAGVADAAYRIVQESLTNVVRHAGTDRARVEVFVRDGALHVTVVDDGGRASDDGTSADHVTEAAGDRDASSDPVDAGTSGRVGEHRGLGLLGMRERAVAVGGTLWAGREGRGFAVRASFPEGAQ